MKRVISVVVLLIVFLIIYFLQANFFNWFTISGIKPNLFIIYILFIGLFAGKKLGLVLGILFGFFIDEVIGKKKDIVKHFEIEIEYCKRCIKEDDEESERMKDVVDMIKEFIKELEKFEENDVVGVFIHPMDEGLHLMKQAKLLEELENWI